MKRFHSYLLGHPFTLITDHKPLLSLLHGQKAVPTQASARIQWWALTLAMYEYTLVFKSTDHHSNADALSRLPLKETVDTPLPQETVLLLEFLDKAPVSATQIRSWTRRDPVLSKVMEYIQTEWPDKEDDISTKPYFFRRTELSVQSGCILWGNRVVVPKQGRQQLLRELHDAHPGISCMKSLARLYIWWPGLDQEIEQLVHACQVNNNTPPSAPLQPWQWPSKPWTRIHVDYAGPIAGHMLLVIVDSHSKWMEVHVMTSSAKATIEHLQITFAQMGLPTTLVSDNGPCFVSEEFKQFLKCNGITHITSAPYHPASNGLAERAVQTLKQTLKKQQSGSLKHKVSQFLFAYRNTPQTTTGQTPAELIFGRQLRTRLSNVKPGVEERVQKKQENQKRNYDGKAKDRYFKVGDMVYVKKL